MSTTRTTNNKKTPYRKDAKALSAEKRMHPAPFFLLYSYLMLSLLKLYQHTINVVR